MGHPGPIRRLTPTDAAVYRALMLRAYAEPDGAFTATVAEREPLPLDWWAKRMPDAPDALALMLGAFDAGTLAGAAGIRFATRPRTRHKAQLYSLYLAPGARGRGLARRLTEAALEHARARPGVRVIQLRVMEPNVRARRLYERLGFKAFGTEPLAVRRDDGFVSVVHMWRALELGSARAV